MVILSHFHFEIDILGVIPQAFDAHTSFVDNSGTSPRIPRCRSSFPTTNKFASDLYTSWSHPDEWNIVNHEIPSTIFESSHLLEEHKS